MFQQMLIFLCLFQQCYWSSC